MSYAFLCRTFYLKCKFVRVFFSYDSFAIVEISYIDSISILQLSIFGRRTEFFLHWIGSQRQPPLPPLSRLRAQARPWHYQIEPK